MYVCRPEIYIPIPIPIPIYKNYLSTGEGFLSCFLLICSEHRRRIELEDKAKVIASDWGTESLPQ